MTIIMCPVFRKYAVSPLSSKPSTSPSVVTISCFHVKMSSTCKPLVVLLLVAGLTVVSGNTRSWEAPGCHLVGHTRIVTIPDCVPFEVTTNACRGFCLSYAIPSPSQTLAFNRNLVITSKAECCGMVDTHDIQVRVACRDGYHQITFKSARSCACSICRRTQ